LRAAYALPAQFAARDHADRLPFDLVAPVDQRFQGGRQSGLWNIVGRDGQSDDLRGRTVEVEVGPAPDEEDDKQR
jgi:hypothetical protein